MDVAQIVLGAVCAPFVLRTFPPPSGGNPSTPGIPCGLALLVRVPLRFAKGRVDYAGCLGVLRRL